MKFSIISNTRKRVPLLKQLVNNITEKTKNLSNIEVLLMCDDDDKGTIDFLKSFNQFNGRFDLRFFVKPRPSNLLIGINELAREARGDGLFVMNDDACILTSDWDEVAEQVIIDNVKKDGIFFLNTSDTSVDKPDGKQYASFPIISKKSVEIIDRFFLEDFVGLGGDSSIFRVYEAVDRVFECRDICIDHLYHNSIEKVINPDQVSVEMRENTQKHFVDPFTCDISQYVEKLKRAINEF